MHNMFICKRYLPCTRIEQINIYKPDVTATQPYMNFPKMQNVLVNPEKFGIISCFSASFSKINPMKSIRKKCVAPSIKNRNNLYGVSIDRFLKLMEITLALIGFFLFFHTFYFIFHFYIFYIYRTQFLQLVV